MEDLRLDTIPKTLLSRILLQLHTLPPKEVPDFIDILSAGLKKYGHTGNINAFLDHCSTLCVQENESWLWKYYEINSELDWNNAKSKKSKELVGMRFLLASESARNDVQLTRYGRNTVLDPKCVYLYGDRILPVDEILKDTLEYLKQDNNLDRVVEELIELRLEKYSRDKFKFQQESSEFDNTTYHLMGSLFVRYDSTSTHGNSPNSWCLYLRDYLNSDGTQWRILLDTEEFITTSEQAIADIRGIKTDECSPTVFSKDYRPVYLFYINQDTLTIQQQEEQQHITLDDYTFDEEEEEEEEEEDESCMHCGIKEIINDVNDMFFCELCNRGVHQLCEDPPILAFEKQVEPWYCRACCKSQGVPLPTPPPPPSLDENTLFTFHNTTIIPEKRKREQE